MVDVEVIGKTVNDLDSARVFRKALRILEERPPNQSKADSPHPKASSDPEPVHSVALAIALRDMAQRLGSVEEKFEADRRAKPAKGSFLIEFFKVIFGGWPALGLLFLILFYTPLRDALNAIPEKVKNAAEVGIFGVSLKSTLKVEAAKLGAGKLSETIPGLSGPAIELLLRAPRSSESLVRTSFYYDEGDTHHPIPTVEFPISSEIDALSELEVQGLIKLQSDEAKTTGSDIRRIIDNFIKTHPGRELRFDRYARMVWQPTKRLGENEQPPMLMWQLSDLGKKAVEVIIKAVSTELAITAVSTELAPKPSPKPNP